jgi:23S rRNA pseudouridine2605 synthase
VRINKYLALCRIGSRRGAEQIILSGRVWVNGATVTNLATDIADTDAVTVDGNPIAPQTNKVYIMLNKPMGIITSVRDQFGRKTVIDLLNESPKQYRELLSSVRLFPVGRLDYDTSGLLIITNDGDLTKTLTHPSAQINKTYIATTDRDITKAELDTLSAGVVIDGTRTAPAVFEYLEHHNRVKIKITLHEGRNRQVRKMFDSVGARIKSLTRIGEGKLHLGNLKTGDWRFLRKTEII